MWSKRKATSIAPFLNWPPTMAIIRRLRELESIAIWADRGRDTSKDETAILCEDSSVNS